MHPWKSEVIPLMPEDVSNRDGNTKQDIELTASKRLVYRYAIGLQKYAAV